MRKHKSIGNVLIDLTPLLDVVFIVLLVVVCQLQHTKSDIAQDKADLADQQAAIETQKEQYEDQLDSLGNVTDYVSFISVNAHFESDLVTRHLTVMNSDKESVIPEIAELRGTSVSEGFTDLRNYLEDYLQEDPDRMIVLSLNEGDEDILYRDEKEIKRIFNELSSEYPNIRQK